MKNQNPSPIDSSGKTGHGLVVFDGFCVLCSGTVKFLLKIDKNKTLKFTTLRSDSSPDGREEAGEPFVQPESVIYIENNHVYTQSEALVQLLKRIGGIWGTASALLRLFPRKWRDALYRLIARHRYRIFGKKNQCFLPAEKHSDRFVDEIGREEIKAIESKEQ